MLQDTMHVYLTALLMVTVTAVIFAGLKLRAQRKRRYWSRITARNELEKRRRSELADKLGLTDCDAISLSAQYEYIVGLSSAGLLANLRCGKITAVQALRAYQAKALRVTAQCNCITEFIWDAEYMLAIAVSPHHAVERRSVHAVLRPALQRRARQLDQLDAANRGVLHGLPISVKESVFIKGLDVTMGLCKFLDQPVEENAVVVDCLMNLGAVPFCRTNLPQTQISYCCSNPIWGVTSHSEFSDRSPGGSSGGEAALISAGGCLLGVGTDLAGSVRVPAAFCGCSSFKPTAGRISFQGIRSVSSASITPCATVGFLARDTVLLTTVFQSLTAGPVENNLVSQSAARCQHMYSLDPHLVPIYWNQQFYVERPVWKIGYVLDLPYFPAVPACKRAVQLCVDALSAGGHRLIPVQLPAVDAECVAMCSQLLMPDGGASFQEALAGEQVDSCLRLMYLLTLLPSSLSRPLALLLSAKFRYIPIKVRGYMSSVGDVLKCVHSRRCFYNDLMQNWRHLHLDVLLMPVFMFPAPLIDSGAKLMFGAVYSFLFNVLNMPCGVLPVTRVTHDDLLLMKKEYPAGESTELRWVTESCRSSDRVPVAVQVVAPRWQDETVLAAMNLLEKTLLLDFNSS